MTKGEAIRKLEAWRKECPTMPLGMYQAIDIVLREAKANHKTATGG